MVLRKRLLQRVRSALRRNPVTVLLGPRQCGKTTLAKQAISRLRRANYFDLEDPAVVHSMENAATVLGSLQGLVVIDEVQRRPELFPILRVLVDRSRKNRQFLILGSASPDLLRQTSESLAGRVEFVEMGGFDLTEVGLRSWRKLWWRGGFPRSFLSTSDENSVSWREQFVRTFLERDIPQLGFNLAPLLVRRFWTMVAHYHGQTWNSSEVAASLGITDTTSRRYLEILAGAYMLRILPPWHQNLAKRQRKAPKVYFTDPGLLHSLLGIQNPEMLLSHPKCGASWEGFAMEHLLRLLPSGDVYYWAVHNGPELDLLYVRFGRRLGFELKFSDAPVLTQSMRSAVLDLKLEKLLVVYPGKLRYSLDRRIEVLPLAFCLNVLRKL